MNPLLRTIDANANRAREALRVMEDAARFALDAAEVSGALKAARHDLRSALDGVGLTRTSLVAHRDTPGDVGTGISTDAERTRSSMREGVVAAGARLSEALRSIEESAKALGLDARAFEALRYRSYELDRVLVAMLARRACAWRLCVLITESLCAYHPWDEVAALAVEGGADCLQLREKSLGGRELVARTRRLVAIAGDRASVVVNDRADVAIAGGAHGVHVGQSDISVADVRCVVGETVVIGVSSSSLDQARRAVREGADCLGVGAMFQTSTKDKPNVAGVGLLRSIEEDPVAGAVPRLAIGGITPSNAGSLGLGERGNSSLGPGPSGIAVSGAVCGSDDPRGVCRALLAAIGAGVDTLGHG